MNILFLSDKPADPMCGGIERVVNVWASEMTRMFHWNCVCAYFYPGVQSRLENIKLEKIELDNVDNQIKNLIEKYKIDVILNNISSKHTMSKVSPVVLKHKELYPNLKHIFVFHTCPGYELVKMDLKFLLNKVLHRDNRIKYAKDFVFQIGIRLVPSFLLEKYVGNKYKGQIVGVDKVVCLIESYVKKFVKYTGIQGDKVIAISNPIHVEKTAKKNVMKEKTVLVVSRLDEYSKRLSRALRIWRKIEEDNRYCDWNFQVVGDGEDRQLYKSLAKEMALERISFEGRQVSKPYYEKASIFITTSQFEGFGMSVLEAMQDKCTVIGLRSNDFLSLEELVSDKQSGFIVDSEVEFVKCLKMVMDDETLRLKIGEKAFERSLRYDVKTIMFEWKNLIEGMMNSLVI